MGSKNGSNSNDNRNYDASNANESIKRKKPFKCELCNHSFDLKSELQYHVASVHEVKRPFNCELCDHSFDLKGKLHQHVASVHEGKKSYKCDSLNILTLNVCGLKSYGRIDQIRNLLLK